MLVTLRSAPPSIEDRAAAISVPAARDGSRPALLPRDMSVLAPRSARAQTFVPVILARPERPRLRILRPAFGS